MMSFKKKDGDAVALITEEEENNLHASHASESEFQYDRQSKPCRFNVCNILMVATIIALCIVAIYGISVTSQQAASIEELRLNLLRQINITETYKSKVEQSERSMNALDENVKETKVAAKSATEQLIKMNATVSQVAKRNSLHGYAVQQINEAIQRQINVTMMDKRIDNEISELTAKLNARMDEMENRRTDEVHKINENLNKMNVTLKQVEDAGHAEEIQQLRKEVQSRINVLEGKIIEANQSVVSLNTRMNEVVERLTDESDKTGEDLTRLNATVVQLMENQAELIHELNQTLQQHINAADDPLLFGRRGWLGGLYPSTPLPPSTRSSRYNCGSEEVATTSSKTLKSPGYPATYPSGLSCNWTITTSGARERIRLTFRVFDTESVLDYLSIQENGVEKRRLHGHLSSWRLFPYTSITNHVTLIFHTDYSLNYRGFYMTYNSI